MTIAVGVWSQLLTPGKEEIIVPQADLRITNVALGEQLSDANGRSVVKLTYTTLISVDNTDDDDDDEQTSPPITSTILCSLTGGKVEQTTVDLILEEDEEYLFTVIGKNPVYVTGNYIDQRSADEPPYNMDSESESDDAYDLREVSSDVEMDPTALDDIELASETSRIEEVQEEAPKPKKRARDSDITGQTKEDSKKLKAEDGKAVSTSSDVGQKKDKKKDKKTAAVDGEKLNVVEKELPGGIKIIDFKVGTGPAAKKGNTVGMRYIGKLQNGKVFDSNKKGKPFIFNLGKGEVIKGWDEGIVGMQVGGERKLTIPAAMAYGKKGSKEIPGNSTLIFEVKLIEIK